MPQIDEQLIKALQSRRPLIYLHSAEESRVVEALRRVARDTPVVTWACTTGFDNDASPTGREPVAAIEGIIAKPQAGLYVFKDLSAFLDDPAVARVLRDAYYRLRDEPDTRLFIVSPVVRIPDSLQRNLYLLDMPLPHADELTSAIQEAVRGYTAQEVADGVIRDIALTLRGLTVDDARYILHGVLGSGVKLTKRSLLDEIRVAKKSFAGSAGFLEYVHVERGLDHVGGLSNFKTWLDERAEIFNRQAVESGLPIPRGILITGISGCGKSLCAKVVAKTWNVPLYRLDMNLVFADMFGNPEATFHRALETIESVAPAVLWIDEIENGLGFERQSGAVQSHIFSAFLTWMQEKPPLVFVAATANRIESLPAELIRKGRFDQVFFVDLPDETERAELFSIHLRANGGDPQDFDINKLVLETEDWNGAEVEQLINTARVATYREQRPFTTADILARTRQIVPLSRTMSEQIKALRNWAWNRATPASQGKGTDYSILEKMPVEN